jgi:hypothetical protein
MKECWKMLVTFTLVPKGGLHALLVYIKLQDIDGKLRGLRRSVPYKPCLIMSAYTHTPPASSLTERHYGIHVGKLDVTCPLANPIGFYATIESKCASQIRNIYSDSMRHATQENSIEKF